MAYKMRLLDKMGTFNIQMPYLTGNISSSKILNYGWLGVLKTWIVVLGDGGKKECISPPSYNNFWKSPYRLCTVTDATTGDIL